MAFEVEPVKFGEVNVTRLLCWHAEGHPGTTGPPGCGDCCAEKDPVICRARMAKYEPERLRRSGRDAAAQRRRHAKMTRAKERKDADEQVRGLADGGVRRGGEAEEAAAKPKDKEGRFVPRD